MGKKLDRHQYTTMEQFAKDMFLVFNNCRQFNPPGTEPVQHAEVLEKVFRKEWSKIVDKKIDPGEKKMLQAILTKLRGEEWLVAVCFPFSQHNSELLCFLAPTSSLRPWILSSCKFPTISILSLAKMPEI